MSRNTGTLDAECLFVYIISYELPVLPATFVSSVISYQSAVDTSIHIIQQYVVCTPVPMIFQLKSEN